MTLTLISCSHDDGGCHVIRNAVKDVDGNKYDAVRIGKQVWMQSNLRTTHFRDGSEIPQGTMQDWSRKNPYFYRPTLQDIPLYDEKTWGCYYNWPAVNDERGLCPKGWHVPTDAEWTEMEEFVGSKKQFVYGDDPSNIAKALASTVGWVSVDTWSPPEYSGGSATEGSPGFEPEKNNSTGFSAMPISDYDVAINGIFGSSADFWSATEASNTSDYYYVYEANEKAINRCISFEYPILCKGPWFKFKGLSVRCVRD